MSNDLHTIVNFSSAKREEQMKLYLREKTLTIFFPTRSTRFINLWFKSSLNMLFFFSIHLETAIVATRAPAADITHPSETAAIQREGLRAKLEAMASSLAVVGAPTMVVFF